MSYDPTKRTDAELVLDEDVTPRLGETAREAKRRVRLARQEIGKRDILRRYHALGNKPPHIDMIANDRTFADAHTIERHGWHIELKRLLDSVGKPTGTRTIEGRLYGDPPWRRRGEFSARWLNEDVLNQTVNRYVQNNWEAIRMELAHRRGYEGVFGTATIGAGYYNDTNRGGTDANPIPREWRPSMTRITIKVDPADVSRFYVVSAFPDMRGMDE